MRYFPFISTFFLVLPQPHVVQRPAGGVARPVIPEAPNAAADFAWQPSDYTPNPEGNGGMDVVKIALKRIGFILKRVDFALKHANFTFQQFILCLHLKKSIRPAVHHLACRYVQLAQGGIDFAVMKFDRSIKDWFNVSGAALDSQFKELLQIVFLRKCKVHRKAQQQIACFFFAYLNGTSSIN